MGLSCAGLAIGKNGAVEPRQHFVYNGGDGRLVESLLGGIWCKYFVKVIGAAKLLAVYALSEGHFTVGFIAFDDLWGACSDLFFRRWPAEKNKINRDVRSWWSSRRKAAHLHRN